MCLNKIIAAEWSMGPLLTTCAKIKLPSCSLSGVLPQVHYTPGVFYALISSQLKNIRHFGPRFMKAGICFSHSHLTPQKVCVVLTRSPD